MRVNIMKRMIKFENIKVGDVLVFSDGKEYDYYIVVRNQFSSSYQLLCPYACSISADFETLEELTESANTPVGSRFLVEVFNRDEVELRVVDDE